MTQLQDGNWKRVEQKSWPSMSKDELLKELERVNVAHRSADQGGIGGATGVSDVIGNVCREQIQQLKDKIEQSKRAQAPAPDAELVEQIALTVSTHQGYRVVTDSSRGLAKEIANVAADALLGPVTPKEWRKASRGRVEYSLNASQIEEILADRRVRLLAPAKTETIQERVEHILTKHFKTIGVVDAAEEIIATLKEGK